MAALGVVAAVTPASAAEDPAAELYRPGIVNVIKLELPPSSIEALEAEPQEYQPGTFSLAETDGTPDGIGEYSAPLEAQIRLKGQGSFQPLGKKSAFKVKFAKKAPFRGLRKLTLNNMIQDGSMLHEAIAYRVFHALGVPASRTSYAEVWVNGVNYGMHANVESLDKVSLEKRFGEFQDPPQHLYEGELYEEQYPSDITALGIGRFQIDEGDEEDRSDLEALLYAHTNPGNDWSDAVAPYANLLEMTRMWMGEKYVGQFDGYTGWTNPSPPSNYYLYSDPTGRFRMFPSGLDWTFSWEVPFDIRRGVLFKSCYDDASCLDLYRAAGRLALKTVPQLDLDTMARCLALRLQPWQSREPPALEPRSAEQVAEAVLSTRAFIAAQPQKLAAYLGVPAPVEPPSGPVCAPYGSEAPESLEELPAEPEEPGEEEPGEEEGEGEEEEPGEEEGPGGEKEAEEPARPASDASRAPVVAAFSPPPLVPSVERSPSPLRIGRPELEGGGLVVPVKSPRSGRLQLSVVGAGGPICSSRRHVGAGTTAVACLLRRSQMEMLSERRPRLTLTAVLETGGDLELRCRRTARSPRV